MALRIVANKITLWIYDLVKTILFAFIVVGILYFSGYFGAIGIILVIIGLASYRIYKQRDYFITQIKVIESVIFGKPLDKDMWEKGEWKNTKIKMVWKKKAKN